MPVYLGHDANTLFRIFSTKRAKSEQVLIVKIPVHAKKGNWLRYVVIICVALMKKGTTYSETLFVSRWEAEQTWCLTKMCSSYKNKSKGQFVRRIDACSFKIKWNDNSYNLTAKYIIFQVPLVTTRSPFLPRAWHSQPHLRLRWPHQ